MRAAVVAVLAAALIGVLCGLAAGYKLWHREPVATTETFRPGTRQADGSVDLTRIPTAPKDAGPPPHQLPKGAKETSRARVKVKPTPKPVEPGQAVCECDPIVIDLSSYTGPGGTGVVASADNGEVSVADSTYTPMTQPAPAYRSFAHFTADSGEGYTAAIGKRFLGGRVGLSIGGAKQPGQEARPLVGVEVNW